MGQLFVFFIIKEFGSLVNVTVTISRKFFRYVRFHVFAASMFFYFAFLVRSVVCSASAVSTSLASMLLLFCVLLVVSCEACTAVSKRAAGLFRCGGLKELVPRFCEGRGAVFEDKSPLSSPGTAEPVSTLPPQDSQSMPHIRPPPD